MICIYYIYDMYIYILYCIYIYIRPNRVPILLIHQCKPQWNTICIDIQ